ncbi:type II secretion system F family protein [Kribbella sp. NPDC049174]|uniref:type II secretion system F family protein n=1 Tax=Kribbella sp. NPDC049174 TaxID=3364112 RepID=UPI0037234AD0
MTDITCCNCDRETRSYIIVGLPIVLGGWLTFSKPEYMSPLYTTPVGLMMVAGGVGLIIVGAFWIRALIKVEA